jgi:hypothetical protein
MFFILILTFKFYIPDFPPQLQCFAERVRIQMQQTYRPSTQRAQHTATVALASFCIYYDVAFPLINIHTLLSFIEFLINSNLAVPTVKNKCRTSRPKTNSDNTLGRQSRPNEGLLGQCLDKLSQFYIIIIIQINFSNDNKFNSYI